MEPNGHYITRKFWFEPGFSTGSLYEEIVALTTLYDYFGYSYEELVGLDLLAHQWKPEIEKKIKYKKQKKRSLKPLTKIQF